MVKHQVLQLRSLFCAMLLLYFLDVGFGADRLLRVSLATSYEQKQSPEHVAIPGGRLGGCGVYAEQSRHIGRERRGVRTRFREGG